MKNYPERYYVLLTERDILKEEIEFIERIGLKDISQLVDNQIYLNKIEAEIKQIEKECAPKEFFMITKEVFDKRNDDEYYEVVGEFYDEETALRAYKEELDWLVTELDENYTMKVEPGLATLEDDDVVIVLLLVKIEAEIDEEI
jgi:hypothetical protein